MTMNVVSVPTKRLTFEVWNGEQAKAAAQAAMQFDGETVIRWISPPVSSNWTGNLCGGTQSLRFTEDGTATVFSAA